MAALLGLIGIIGLVAVSTLWKGYVLSVLWVWFAVPLGAPAVGVIQAMGIALLVSFLTYQHIRSPKKEQSTAEAIGDATGMALMYPLIALGVGWCIKYFL